MNFEKKFDTYDENAHIQKSVADTLVEFLDDEEIAQMADRIIRIEDGRIVVRG